MGMKRALVTGSSGFIGKHLCEHLRSQGYLVGRFDIEENSSADVRVPNKTKSHLSIDCIFHLAAETGVRQSLLTPADYYKTNVLGTLNMLEFARLNKTPMFVLASTSSVYSGHPTPFRTDTPTDMMVSPYAASKKSAEDLCRVYSRVYGMNVAVLRYFTVYGENGRKDMMVHRVIDGILNKKKITVYGDGRQQRDFTYVGDIVEGTYRASQHRDGFDLWNLGYGKAYSVLQLIRFVERMLKTKAKVEFKRKQKGDAVKTLSDSSLTRAVLNWSPKVPFEEGIKRTIRDQIIRGAKEP